MVKKNNKKKISKEINKETSNSTTNPYWNEEQRVQQRFYDERVNYEAQARAAYRDDSPNMGDHYMRLAKAAEERAIADERGSW